MKKILWPAILGVLGSWTVVAQADVGIGMSIQSGDPTVYVPIDFGAFRLEPFVFYSYDKSEEDVFVFPGLTVHQTTTYEAYQLGLGLFGLSSLGDSIRAYYGGRIAYQSSKSESDFIGSSGNNEFSTEGFLIAPTLGLEYFFTDRFSIAGEASVIFRTLEGENNREDESRTTDTNVVVRYRF